MISRLKYNLRYLFGVGLTKVPSIHNAAISDLFIWTKLHDFNISYEYIGITDLFDASFSLDSYDDCTIMFFDPEGNMITSKIFNARSLSRNSINISSIISDFDGEYGSFSVFHNNIPASVLGSSSFLAERGYTGYSVASAVGKSYVHGNLDAVANYRGVLQPLGITSPFIKSYYLQSIFTPDQQAYIALVNPANRTNKIKLLAIPLSQSDDSKYLINFQPSGNLIPFKTIDLNPLGSLYIEIPSDLCPCRIVVKSHLPMARPLCFVLTYNHLNVYHG